MIPVRKKLAKIPIGMPAEVSDRANVCYVSGNHFLATMLCEMMKKGEEDAIRALPAATKLKLPLFTIPDLSQAPTRNTRALALRTLLTCWSLKA